MSTAKDQIKQMLESQPEDSTYDDILREIAFKSMVNRGMADVASGNVISNEDMKEKIKGWRK